MKLVRPALALVGLLLPLAAVVPPAAATDTVCSGSSPTTRCAWTRGEGNDATAFGSIASTLPRVRVRVRVVALQRQTRDGWVPVSTRRSRLWIRGGGQTQTTWVACADARSGRYRSVSVAQWKQGPDGRVRTDRVASTPVRKARLCD